MSQQLSTTQAVLICFTELCEGNSVKATFFFICDIDVSNVSLTNLYEKVSLINLAYHLNFCALSNDIAYL